MIKFARKLSGDRSGATAIEYGLIAAAIALAIVGGLAVIGPQLKTTFNNVGSQLTTQNSANN